MKIAEVRELTVDDLRTRAKELDDELFRLRIQKSMGNSRRRQKCAVCVETGRGSRRSCVRSRSKGWGRR